MTHPEIDLVRDQKGGPQEFPLESGMKLLVVNRGYFKTLNDDQKKTYLENLDHVLEEAEKRGDIAADVRENFRESIQTSLYANDVDTDDFSAKVDGYALVVVDTSSRVSSFIPVAISGGADYDPLADQIYQDWSFEHEKAHVLGEKYDPGLEDPGADYAASLEILRKYGDAAIPYLERLQDYRMTKPFMTATRDSRGAEYGYECALSISDAIYEYKNGLAPYFRTASPEEGANYISSLVAQRNYGPSAADYYSESLRRGAGYDVYQDLNNKRSMSLRPPAGDSAYPNPYATMQYSPELIVRNQLSKIFYDPALKISGDTKKYFQDMSPAELREVVRVAAERDVFKDASEEVRATFAMLQESADRIAGRGEKPEAVNGSAGVGVTAPFRPKM